MQRGLGGVRVRPLYLHLHRDDDHRGGPNAVIGSTLALSSMSALTAGNTDDLVVTVALPTTADNSFQEKSATIEYTFVGTQRTGTNK